MTPKTRKSLFTRSVVTAATHGRTKQRPAPALTARPDVKSKAKRQPGAGRCQHPPPAREPVAPGSRPSRTADRTAPCSDRRPGPGGPRPPRVQGGAQRHRRRRREAPLTRADGPRKIESRSGSRPPPAAPTFPAGKVKPGPEPGAGRRNPRPGRQLQSESQAKVRNAHPKIRT
jgi:hypothetical protein